MGAPRAFLPCLLPAALACFLAGGCCSLEPTPSDWENVGLYRTPRQSFRTFQVALAEDVPALGHRSFSLRFMAENQLSGLAWRVLVDQLETELPFFSCIAGAEVTGQESLGPDRERLTAEVTVLFSTYRFWIDFVREDYWEAWRGDELLSDDSAAWGEMIDAEGEKVRITLPTYGEYEAGDATELRVGREWKIDAFGTFET